MVKSKSNVIVYSLYVEDTAQVAEEEPERELTAKEMALVIKTVPDYINWTDAIAAAIRDALYTLEHPPRGR